MSFIPLAPFFRDERERGCRDLPHACVCTVPEECVSVPKYSLSRQSLNLSPHHSTKITKHFSHIVITTGRSADKIIISHDVAHSSFSSTISPVDCFDGPSTTAIGRYGQWQVQFQFPGDGSGAPTTVSFYGLISSQRMHTLETYITYHHEHVFY